MLVINSVSKTFKGNARAVQNLSFEARPGEILGVLGPNGAGKTTTIRMILNIISPDSGSIQWNGRPILYENLSNIGYLPEERGLYRKSRVGDALAYFASLKLMSSSNSRSEMRKWLARFDLNGMENRRVEELSKGNQQKVQLIAAILHQPDLLILDEPFSGLDPINQQLFSDIIRELSSKGAAIIFCTHQLEAAESYCDKFVILNKGRSALNGTLDEIRKGYSKNIIRVKFVLPPTPQQISCFSAPHFVLRVHTNETETEFELQRGASLNDLATAIIPIASISAMEAARPSLLSIFLSAVGANDNVATNIGDKDAD